MPGPDRILLTIGRNGKSGEWAGSYQCRIHQVLYREFRFARAGRQAAFIPGACRELLPLLSSKLTNNPDVSGIVPPVIYRSFTDEWPCPEEGV